MRARHLQVLGGLVVLGGLLRFATLDLQSYWYDEAVTVELIRMDLFDMLGEIPESESTPPLYYVVAWLWAKIFGTGEVGLRSLSALCGTAFIPVIYAAAGRLATRRVALIAAALAAVNPLLVWYSQEARAYALLTLLAGLSFFYFARLLSGDAQRRTVALWALVSALALTTHYFAAFLVAVEGIWLLAAAANRRPIAWALASLTAVELALLPLLLQQRSLDLADFIDEIPLGHRLARAPKQFLVGFDSPGEVASAIVAGLLVLAAVWFLWSRAEEGERRAARIGGVVGGILFVGPALLALIGVDYFDTRNILIAWPALAITVAAGLGAQRGGRGGLATAVALCLVCGSTVVFVAANSTLQRDNWRGVAEELVKTPAHPKAVVVTPSPAATNFEIYAPQLEAMPDTGAEVYEIDLIALPKRKRTQARPGTPPRPENHPPPAAGFQLTETHFEDTYTLMRYQALAPVLVTPAALAPMHIDLDRSAEFFVAP